MKLTALFIFAATIQLQATVYSQSISLSLRDAPLQKVFKLIQKQSGYNFLYTHELLNDAGKVDIYVQNGSLEDALAKSLEGTGLDYSIVEKTIVIKKRMDSPAFPIKEYLPLPPIEITGKVTNEQDQPIQGVSVQVKGTRIGSVTDISGNYSLNVPDNSSKVLIFSFVGMETQEVTVSRNAMLSIKLKTVQGQEQEIIVRGYGTQKKANLTGSVAAIGGDRIVNRPVTNISVALQGQMPGVQVIGQSGQPGRDVGTIRIRGTGTMNNSDALVIVDGIIGSMNDLNPNDIENISVLKDASSAAIYGSRAANGVILVTTKRGKSGTPKVRYSGYVGKQDLITLPEFLNSYEYATLLNEGLRNQGQAERFSSAEIAEYKKTVDHAPDADPVAYPNTNWMDLLWQGKGIQHSHNISVSGGSESSKYLLSLGYLKQDGLIKRNSNERYNVRFNLDSKVSDRLTIGMSSSLSNKKITEPSGGRDQNTVPWTIVQLYRVPSTYGNKTPDGKWIFFIDGNPISYVEEGGLQNDKMANVLGDVFAEFKILPGLKLRSSAGIDYNNLDRTMHVKDIHYSNGNIQGPNFISDLIDRSTRTMLQSTLNYQKSFGSHNLNVLAGVARESYRFDHNDAFRQDLPSNDLTELNAGSTVGWTNGGYSLENSLGSYFGRVNYDYKGKYLIEGSIRRDGSSKFAEDKRWGTFPSFSAGWRLSEENFIKSINAISDLKVRVSYGTAGNNQTADYQYIPRVALGRNYPFFGQIAPGGAQVSATNPDLQWEKSTTFDVGLDLGLLNNRLNFTVDYYDRYTDNILIGVPVSVIYGLPAPTVNAGAMRNKGIEFLISHKNHVGKFTYNASANIAFNKNVADKFANPAINDRIRAQGYEWNAWYGYETAGLYQTEDQLQNAPKVPGSPVILGDIMFKDQNKDGVINGSDRVVLGSDIPRITYGFNVGVEYKNFDLSIFAQGMAKVKQLVTYQLLFPFFNGATGVKRTLDRWTPETPNSPNPATHVDQVHNFSTISNASVINANYMRLKNIQLGYTIPQSALERIKVSSIRIFVGGENLLTFTKMWSGLDPEATMSREYDAKYPNVKTYTVGLNVNF
ncbi:MAG: TonB-dependent receptor [Flavitalea sp.]